MQYQGKTTDAFRILYRRFIEGNRERERSVREERKIARGQGKEPTRA